MRIAAGVESGWQDGHHRRVADSEPDALLERSAERSALDGRMAAVTEFLDGLASVGVRWQVDAPQQARTEVLA